MKDLTTAQARQIMDEMYYQRYNIDSIQNPKLARNTFDFLINQGTDAGKVLADTINEYFQTDYSRNMVISQQLANKINNLSDEDATQINDIYTEKRMDRHFNLVDEHPKENINNLKGWYRRDKSFYSDPQEFDNLYKQRLDEYLENKYLHYYTGR